jgi:hypothetical protein
MVFAPFSQSQIYSTIVYQCYEDTLEYFWLDDNISEKNSQADKNR